MTKPILLLIVLIPLLNACSTLKFEGSSDGFLSEETGKVLLVPFVNTTSNGAAGTALTETTASALSSKGIQWTLPKNEDDGRGALETASRLDCAYVLTGSVHEYEYKTDLDGNPAVGASATLRSVRSGDVIWQGSASATGYSISSLSMASQKVADRLVGGMKKKNFLGW